MNPAYYLPIIMLLIIVCITAHNEKALIKRIINKKNKSKKERFEMVEIAKRFIDKECLIYTYNSQIDGVVKEVSDGAILLEKGGVLEAVNIDYVVRLREYPKNKKGKKKSVVLD